MRYEIHDRFSEKYFPFTSAAGWRRLFTFVLVCLIIPLLLIGLYARPYADDCGLWDRNTCSCAKRRRPCPVDRRCPAHRGPVLQQLAGNVCLLLCHVAAAGDLWRPFIFSYPLLLIGGIFLCLFIVFHIVTKRFLSGRPSFRFLLSLLCTAVVLCGLPPPLKAFIGSTAQCTICPGGLPQSWHRAALRAILHLFRLKKSILLVISVLLSFVISGGTSPLPLPIFCFYPSAPRF